MTPVHQDSWDRRGCRAPQDLPVSQAPLDLADPRVYLERLASRANLGLLGMLGHLEGMG